VETAATKKSVPERIGRDARLRRGCDGYHIFPHAPTFTIRDAARILRAVSMASHWRIDPFRSASHFERPSKLPMPGFGAAGRDPLL
jgi:hypothetical protein